MQKSLHANDPFFQYATNVFKTSEGDVALPMFFYECENHFAMFAVDIDKARALTEKENLTPVDFGKGKAIAAVASYNYKKVSIDPYLEVGLAIACVPKDVEAPKDPMASLLGDPDLSTMGFYVVHLPVTTQQAVAAGIDLWGFPKFKADIAFKLDGDRFEGKTIDPKSRQPIYTLSGEAGIGATLPAIHAIFMTRLKGVTLRIHAPMRGLTRYALPGSLKLGISDVDHPMAHDMRALGLDGAVPQAVFYSSAVMIRLYQGAPLP